MKTNKELAVELMGHYLRAIYSQEKMKPMNADGLNTLLSACYEAVKNIPND